MNCLIDYDEHSIETVNTIMEEHKSVLPLQGYVGRDTNQSDAAMADRQTSNGHDGKKEVPRRQQLDDFNDIWRC